MAEARKKEKFKYRKREIIKKMESLTESVHANNLLRLATSTAFLMACLQPQRNKRKPKRINYFTRSPLLTLIQAIKYRFCFLLTLLCNNVLTSNQFWTARVAVGSWPSAWFDTTSFSASSDSFGRPSNFVH